MARGGEVHCPLCAKPMAQKWARILERRKAPVHHCQNCLGLVVKADAVPKLSSQVVRPLAVRGESAARCSDCERLMEELEITHRDPSFEALVVDRCPVCAALFFEPGELERAAGRPALVALAEDDEYLDEDPDFVPATRDHRGRENGDSGAPTTFTRFWRWWFGVDD